MSRASVKRRKNLQRRAQQNYGGMPSFNDAMKTLVTQQVAKMMQQPGQGVIFSPGVPLNPQPGVTPDHTPRQFSFPLAINTSGVDRTLGKSDIPSFQQLRMLAKMYSGITLPERVWLDMVPGLKLKIGLTAEMKAEGYDDKDFQKEISAYRKFFEKPDKKLDYHSWLRKALRSQTQIDELYVFKRRTRGGQLYALEIADGATFKPLLDDWGRTPEPPDFAYQQYPWGLPGDWFTTDELIHYQETPQDDSPFGFSRVERFMLEVNQALRKKRRDLAMFTEGNVPAGLMEVPEATNWTPDEIDKYEKLWNSLIAGNEQQQVRVKFTQPGMKYIKTDNGEILTDFDYFLYKIACGCYGISLQDIGFVEDIHKSSNEGQQNMLFRRTLQPIVVMYAKLFFTDIIHEEFNDPRFEATFNGYEEEEDTQAQAQTFATMAGVGAISPSDIAHKMGYPDVPKTGPFIMTKSGPFFLKDYEEGSDLRTAQKQAQLTGMQLATTSPGQQTNQENEEEEDDNSTQSQEEGKAVTGKKPKTAESNSRDKSSQAEKSEERNTSRNDAQLNRSADSEVGQKNTGMMLAFMLDPAIAKRIALPDGESPADMHVTLAYLGDMNDDPPQGMLNPANTRDAISAVLKAFAQSSKPLQGNVGGLGRFTLSDSSDGMSPVIALMNVPGLQDFRRRLVDVIETAGYGIAKDFDYTPHCTLAYIPADTPMPVDSIENVPLAFNDLCLAIGDDRYYFPIGEETHGRSQSTENGLRRSESSEQAIRAEYKRWRTCALHDIERGRNIRSFESNILPLGERAKIQDELTRATSSDQVRAIFKAAQEGDTSFFERAASRKKWRPPSIAQLGLEATLTKAIKAFVVQAKLARSGATMPDEAAHTKLLDTITDCLEQAVHEGRRIATGTEQRSIISATHNLAGRAVQLISDIVDTLREKVQEIIQSLFGRGDIEENTDALLEQAEEQLEEWAESYSEGVAENEIQTAVQETIIEEMKNAGATLLDIVLDPDACEVCVGIVEESPTVSIEDGEKLPPYHFRCRCGAVQHEE